MYPIPSFTIYKEDKVSSTNTLAKQRVANGALPSGAVIVAETQTQGRGQRQTLWHDSYGENLLFTVVLKDLALAAHDFFRLNMLASLAIVDVLNPHFKASIKWPNDIFIGMKKVAGILIETNLQGNKINTAFIGIGLNVNQTIFSPELNATSLALTQGTPQNKDLVLQKILSAMQKRLGQLWQNEAYQKDYCAQLLGTKSLLTYRANQQTFEATIETVKPDGRMVLRQCPTGELVAYKFKEVELVR